MGRKDLSRTVIEGGRYWHNSAARRASHGRARASTREYLACADAETFDGADPRPLPRVRKMFRDKLAPALRWIDAQVGRPWAKVRADLFARFDARTIAGQHVLFDHMLSEVWPHGEPEREMWSRAPNWYVDAHGILRRVRWLGMTSRRFGRWYQAWLGKRRALLVTTGERWWFARAQARWDAPIVWTPIAPVPRGDLRLLARMPAWAQRHAMSRS